MKGATRPSRWPRDFAREALPRLEGDLAERVAYALAWYQAGIRASDIGAATKLSGFAVSVAVAAAGLVPRSEVGAARRLSLVEPLTDLRAGSPPEAVAERYLLGPVALRGVVALLEAGRARRARDPVSGVPKADPPSWRCQRCEQRNVLTSGRCLHCGLPR